METEEAMSRRREEALVLMERLQQETAVLGTGTGLNGTSLHLYRGKS